MATQYPVLKLKSGRDRSVFHRHPWLFSGGVASCQTAQAGDIVQVTAADGDAMAWGHYSPNSQIAVRMFYWAATPQERPTFDDAWWQARFEAAASRRPQWLDLGETTGYRIINAEGDGLPGMVADRYSDTVVVQLRTEGAQRLRSALLAWLRRVPGVTRVLEKPETADALTPEHHLLGKLEGTVPFLENGLKFLADPLAGQKTGFFLDQRRSRELAGSLACDRRVLNAFAYSGGFGVYALQGGAKHVTSVDISGPALALCDQNMALNFKPADVQARHTSLKADCFDYLRNLPQGEFDLIVLDPPAFSKHIKTVDKAARGYKDINMYALKALPPGGMLFTFSCSQHVDAVLFRQIVFAAAVDAGRQVRVLRQTGHAEDHAFSIYHPEGEYLKGLLLYVD